ncbi:MAG: amidohydrolase [Firmicutes bacterium]|nr:amidohydrolase [Bacillota bacterium]
MIIDSHAHVMLPPEKQLQWMNEAGVDRTVLFTSSVHPETAKDIEGFAGELSKLYDILQGKQNLLQQRIQSIEELSGIIKENPQKYIGFGSIPFGLSYQENLTWITKYILGNGFKGIGEMTPGTGEIGKMEALFQAVQDSGNLPLWVHTFFPLDFTDIKELLQLSRKYPSVPLILGHMGGIHWLNTLKAIRDIPNIYVDLSATFTTVAPTFAIREYPDRTLFSSDAPYASPLAVRTVLEQIVDDKKILQMVLGGNIARLLKL